ncbi:MAG: hypothetical protein KAS17_10165 [Victivallaceae bacterium]|nr:hypothetical protein [Victivallaceae bacterium]
MKSIFLVLFFLITFVVNAQSSANWFKSGSVKLVYRPSPLFYVFNQSTTNKPGSPGWLMVKVKYTASSKKKGNKVMWLDDIIMETEVIVPGSYQSKNVTVLLKGKTNFWSIPMDGKTHQALGCIPPQVIARFARKGNKIALSKIIARVTFYTAGRKILMRLYSSSGSRVRNYFNKLGGAVSTGMVTVEDIVMPRTKTPWVAINYELFDVIKPDPQK